MAGGIWSPTDISELPGMYMLFQAAAAATIEPGARGTVIVPVKAHWGPARQFVEVVTEQAITDIFSHDESDGATAKTTLRLALLGQPKKVLAYRLTDSNAAPATKIFQDTAATPANVLKIEAKYPGGNNFKITIANNLVDNTRKDIKLYDGTTLLRTFTYSGPIAAAADAINADTGNKWIVAVKLADGNGVLANISNVSLEGGNSGIAGITTADYIAAMSAFETQEDHVLALDGVADAALQTSIVSWVTRLRNEGRGIIAVLGGSAADDIAGDAVSKAISRSAAFNHEGIVNVGTGATLNGITYSSAQISAYVAGLIAGKSLSQSTTYAASPFEDVSRRWTRSEQEQAVRNGVFLLIHDGRIVKALKGVNSLATLRQGQNRSWKKIRTIRVMDQVNMDLQRTAEEAYIGKVNNTEEGRLSLIGAMKQYLQTLAAAGVIEANGATVMLDPDYYGSKPVKEPEPDQVFVRWTAKLTDVMEQIFGTFTVK